jgi:hypothetical protein
LTWRKRVGKHASLSRLLTTPELRPALIPHVTRRYAAAHQEASSGGKDGQRNTNEVVKDARRAQVQRQQQLTKESEIEEENDDLDELAMEDRFRQENRR